MSLNEVDLSPSVGPSLHDATVSSIAPPPPVFEPTLLNAALPPPQLKAIEAVTVMGKRTALLYRTPTDQCYAFQWKRDRKVSKVYICSYCKNRRINVRITVQDGFFQQDPEALPHICESRSWAEEAAKRIMYLTTQEKKQSQEYVRPKKRFLDVLQRLDEEADDEEEKNAVCAALGNFQRHIRTLSHAANAKRRRVESMEQQVDLPSGK